MMVEGVHLLALAVLYTGTAAVLGGRLTYYLLSVSREMKIVAAAETE
jgi:hypothetical protein